MHLRTIILTALLALSLAGCGVKGGLEPPSARDAPEGAAASSQGLDPAPVDDRPFILDGLLL